MTIVKGTVKWYKMTRKDSDAISGRINVKDKLASIIDFPEKEDLHAEHDTEKQEVIIRRL
jgi:chemotaxis signal transduction protein